MEGADEPARQLVQSPAPSLPSVDVPAAQGSHVVANVAPTTAENFPWPHLMQGEPSEGL